MDSNTLQVFVSVARAASFAQAARQHSVAPSSVSRTIEVLERELGVRLFQRSTRKLAITEAGERLLEHAEPALELLERAALAARGPTSEAAGVLRVTAPVAFGQVVLTPILAEFVRVQPKIALDLVLRDDVVDLVQERVDIALRLGKLADSSLVAHKLAKLSYAACASPAYLAQRGAPRHPSELRHHDCLRYPVHGVGPSWRFRDPSGARDEVEVRGPITINHGGALQTCALAGLGIILVPRWNVEDALMQGTLVELFPSYEMSLSALDAGIWMVFPTRRQRPAKVRLFADFLRRKLGMNGARGGRSSPKK